MPRLPTAFRRPFLHGNLGKSRIKGSSGAGYHG